MGTKPIIEKEKSEKIVFEYKPKEFPFKMTGTAEQFVNQQGTSSSSFSVSPIVAEQAGIAELNRRKVEQRVEQQALERLKEVEERAYKEAYDLGLEEGRQKAFEAVSSELKDRLSKLDNLLYGFESIKDQLIDQNEIQIVRLVYLIASRIAMREIECQSDIIIDVISEIIKEAQSDENIQIYVSKKDFDFIEELKEKAGTELSYLKNIKFASSEKVETGGCVLESNFGMIDATVNQRVEKAWEAIQDRLPHIKSSTSQLDESNNSNDESEDS